MHQHLPFRLIRRQSCWTGFVIVFAAWVTPSVEQSYSHSIKRFILYHGKRHPAEMGKAEVESFLTSLAVERNVSASTQNLALSAILFLYREVLETPLPWLESVTRAKKPVRRPTVLTRQEVQAVLAGTEGTARAGSGAAGSLQEGLRSIPWTLPAAGPD